MVIGRQFKFTQVKVIKLGVEHYDYNTSCGNNNVWHNDSDHAYLPYKVLKMEGVDLLLALFFGCDFFQVIFIMIFNILLLLILSLLS